MGDSPPDAEPTPPTSPLPGGSKATRLSRTTALLRERLAPGSHGRSTLIAFVIAGGGAGLSFVAQLVLAQTMEQSAYGAYLYTLALMNLVLIAGRLEFDSISVRWVSEYLSIRDWPRVRGFLQGSSFIVGTACTLVAILGALMLTFSDATVARRVGPAGYVACFLIPVSGYLVLTSSVLRGLKSFISSQVPFVVVRPLLLVTGVVLYRILSPNTLSTRGALVFNLIAATLALGLLLLLLVRELPVELKNVTPRFEWSAWFSTASAFLVMSAAQLVLSEQMDLLIVGSMLSTADAALYGAAGQLSALILLGVASVMFVGAPRIAELFASRRIEEFRRHIRQSSWLCVAVSLPVFGALALAGEWLLSLYGNEFRAAYPILLLLATAQLTSAVVGGHAGQVVSMTGLHHAGATIIAVSALLNLVLAVVLTQRYGMIGTATATLIATVVRSIALDGFLRYRLGVTVVPH